MLLMRSDSFLSNPSYEKGSIFDAPHDHRPDNRRRWWLISFLHYIPPGCKAAGAVFSGACGRSWYSLSFPFAYFLRSQLYAELPGNFFLPGPVSGVWRPKMGVSDGYVCSVWAYQLALSLDEVQRANLDYWTLYDSGRSAVGVQIFIPVSVSLCLHSVDW